MLNLREWPGASPVQLIVLVVPETVLAEIHLFSWMACTVVAIELG